MVKRLALIAFLFTLPAHAQTSIPIKNPSFELTSPMTDGPAAGWGSWNNGPLDGWTLTGISGAFQTALTPPDGKTVAWSNGGIISQDLGIVPQPNTMYVLTVYVAHLTGSDTTFTLSLNAGTVNLCSATSPTSAIPASTFAPQTLHCQVGATVPAGNLIISLVSGGVQVEFDNVSLVIPGAPPAFKYVLTGFGTFTFPMAAPPDCSDGTCFLVWMGPNGTVTLLPGQSGQLVIQKPGNVVTVVTVGP